MKRFVPFFVLLTTTLTPTCHAQNAGALDATATSARPVAPVAAQQAFDMMMGALQDDDYNAFISLGTPEFQHAISKMLFEEVAAQVGPRAKEGLKMTFLDSLQKRSFSVYLWKIKFKSGDDVLGQMSISNGKIDGFLLS